MQPLDGLDGAAVQSFLVIFLQKLWHGQVMQLLHTEFYPLGPAKATGRDAGKGQTGGTDVFHDIAQVFVGSVPVVHQRSHIPVQDHALVSHPLQVTEAVCGVRLDSGVVVGPADGQEELVSMRQNVLHALSPLAVDPADLGDDPEGVLIAQLGKALHDLQRALDDLVVEERLRGGGADADGGVMGDKAAEFHQRLNDLFNACGIAPDRLVAHGEGLAAGAEVIVAALHMAVGAVEEAARPKVDAEGVVRYADAEQRILRIDGQRCIGVGVQHVADTVRIGDDRFFIVFIQTLVHVAPP